LIRSGLVLPLIEPRRPLRAILIGWLAASIPALALATLATALFPHVAGPKLPVNSAWTFFAVTVFSPVAETLIMALLLEVALLALPPRAAIILSSAGWGVVHSLAAPAWGLIIWWPFLIFSTLYVTWRSQGRAKALAIVVAVHALNNLGPALLLLRSA
jgi:hypothetical protein